LVAWLAICNAYGQLSLSGASLFTQNTSKIDCDNGDFRLQLGYNLGFDLMMLKKASPNPKSGLSIAKSNGPTKNCNYSPINMDPRAYICRSRL
jgi:hypothetical protein